MRARGEGYTSDTPAVRERERLFFAAHPDLELELIGQWVALDGDELVAHGDDLAVVIEQARRAGHPHPFLTRVFDPASTFIFA